MGISSPGIGSNLDVNGIVTKLMAVESQPLQALDTKEASYQAKLSAYGNLKSALSSFQSALTGLNSPDKFQSLQAESADLSILTATASSKAAPGNYNINILQLAQAQSLATAGRTSSTATIGTGASTTISFQFGTISGGSYAKTGTALGAGIAANGIAANSLSINGTTIVTGASTNSAKALAAQINLATATTGVTATAQATDTGTLAYTDVQTGDGDAYSLVVGNTTLASIGASSTFTAADLDNALSGGIAASLAAEGITVSGTAAGGDLRFTRADGANIDIKQTLTNTSGSAAGGVAGLASGTAKTYTSSVSLSSAGAILVGGINPAAAGLTGGNGVRSGATFTQDANQTSGTVTIDSTNNSLQGIRDAINKAGIGVTASIVSDGGAAPNRLVLTSNKTGATTSMKITVSGDAAISDLLSYDPAGTQNLTENTAAQNTALTINGLPITSSTNTVSEAIQGVTINAVKVGSTTLSVSKDTQAVQSGVNAFVQAYNDLNKTLQNLTSYDPATKNGGLLLGDATARSVQVDVRKALTTSIAGLDGAVKSLSDIGVSFQKDGTLKVDSSKLQKAIDSNLGDIGKLFASMGNATDSLIDVAGSTNATQPGNYAVNITAMATQGKVTGSNAAGLTIISGVNDELNITVDGSTASVKLAPGTYTAQSLAAEAQSAINGASIFSASGIAVNVGANASGIISITSNRYGSASTVNVVGSGAENLLGSAPVISAGTDVAGTIAGVPGTGIGQTLTGATGSPADGLKLQINGGSAGDRGVISFTRGYSYLLDRTIAAYVDDSGQIAARTDGINSSIKDIDSQRDALNERLQTVEARYRAQFTALDTMIGQMSQTTAYLTQQLALIANQSKE